MEQEINRWYANRIPHINSPLFPRFLGEGANFVRYIVGEGRLFSIRFSSDAVTARADTESGDIVLPLWPLSPSATQEMFPNVPAVPIETFGVQTIGLINGFLIHEAWHIKETPAFYVFFRYAGEPTNQNLFHTATNIVEDVFINSEIKREPYGLFVEYGCLVARCFLQPSLNQYHEAISKDSRVLEATINMLFRYTDVWNTDDPVWDEFRDYTNIIDQVVGQTSINARANIARELYDKLVDLAEEHGEEPNQGFEDNKGIDGDGIFDAQTSKDHQNAREAEIEFRSRVDQDSELRNIPSVIEEHIDEYTSQRTINPDSRFLDVGRIMALLRTKNYTPGVPRESGTHILPTRLWRAATDRRIFGVPRPVEKSDKDEVIFLLDFSGSIGYPFRREIAAAALGCAYSLRESRLRFMIFAHTGTSRPRVYRIATHNMQGTTPDLRRAFAKSLEISMSNNYDGFAIQHVGQYFSQGTHNKTLIILSDGQPAGHGYGGEEALDHTVRMAEKLRKRGIRVLGMSLVITVVDVNIRIYGAKNHVDATGNVSEALRSTLLTRI